MEILCAMAHVEYLPLTGFELCSNITVCLSRMFYLTFGKRELISIFILNETILLIKKKDKRSIILMF